MDYLSLSKTVAIGCIIIVVANLLLFSFRVISWVIFFAIIILMAIIAFPGMKWIARKAKERNRQK